ncbi:MAG: CHAD domain-containing protein [Elusimicrobia bacterium]|nr:CHAD domain-containing protein [Elusimicrobiota bacterium]
MRQSMPAGEAAAGLARLWLGRALKAAGGLRSGKDAQALHDLRTSLRRLRVVLAAYRGQLGPAAARPLRRRLQKVSRMTGPARDAQVWAAWLRGGGAPCHITSRLIIHLGAVSEHCRKEFLRQGLPELKAAARGLKERLERVRPGTEPFAEAARRAAAKAAVELDCSLAAARRGGTPAQSHAARIKVKRLRYILEPCPGTKALAKRLRGLQELLGRLHDAQQLMTCAVPPASEPARQEALRLEAELRRGWLRSGKAGRLARACLEWAFRPISS